MKDSHEKGLGAVSLNGVLIDAASIRQAQVIVQQMKMIQARSA
jgi:citrate lyase beta subunit